MGLESIIREHLEKMCPRAFRPTDLSDVGNGIRDLNMALRRVPVCYNSRNIFTDSGVRAWGDILTVLWRNEAALFNGGIDVLVEQLDGKAPRAKEREQASRLQRNLDARKRELDKHRGGQEVERQEEEAEDGGEFIAGTPAAAGPTPLGAQEAVSSFRWPDEDDGSPWFAFDARPQCSMDDVYYHPIAKRKWYEFVTEWLLYQAPIPRGKTLIVDCGALGGTMLRRPVCAHVDTNGVRTVREMEEHEPYWDIVDGRLLHRSYEEADDRILYWVLHFAPGGRGTMVITEDGDLTPALMTTYRSRVETLAHTGRMGRLLLRRTNRVGTLKSGAPVNEPQVIDIDMLASHIELTLGGLITEGIQYDGNWEQALDGTDPVILYSLFALMRKNDYSHELPRLSFTNIIRAAMEKPEIVRRLITVDPPARYAPLEGLSNEQIDAYLNQPRQILINWEAFFDFVRACYREVWKLRPRGVKKDGKPSMRADQSEKQAPIPSEKELRGKCARVSWTLDKMVNGGKRGYVIAPELAVSIETNLPIFGYHEIEIEIHDPSATNEKDKKKKRKIVSDSNNVHIQSQYGVRQMPLS